MMTPLATIFRFEESLWTLWIAFTEGQVPVFGAFHALITSRSVACATTQVAFLTRASVAVVATRAINELKEKHEKLVA